MWTYESIAKGSCYLSSEVNSWLHAPVMSWHASYLYLVAQGPKEAVAVCRLEQVRHCNS